MDAGTAVPGYTADSAPPRTAVRQAPVDRVSRHGHCMAVRPGLQPLRGFWLRCTVVQRCGTVMSSAICLRFASFDARDSLEPLIFLENRS